MNSRLFLLLSLVGVTTTAHSQPAAEAPKQTELKIEPTFVDLKETTFAGIATYAGPASPQFPALWDGGFNAVIEEVKAGAQYGVEAGKYTYGLELFPPNFERKREFTYMACYAVSDSRKVPLHLVQRTVPASKYAIFEVPNGLAGLGDTFGYIYSRWLPQSNYQRAFAFDMERYEMKTDPAGGKKLVVEVLVPVITRK